MQLVDRADWRKVSQLAIPSPVAATALGIALEAPYRLPTTLYLDDMEPPVSAKVNELEDHVWGLREDSVYFADVCEQAFDHNIQTMKPSKDSEAPALIHFPEPVKRDVLEEVVISSHRFLALWHECKQALDDVMALQSRYRKVTSDQELDIALTQPLVRLWCILFNIIDQSRRILESSMLTSSQTRQMLTFTYADKSNGHEIWEPTIVESRAKIEALPEQVQCSYYFFMSTTLALYNCHVPTRVEGYLLWLNQLELCRANNPSAADWFSSHVEFIFSSYPSHLHVPTNYICMRHTQFASDRGYCSH
jgi:hypothetical protein